MQLYVYMIMENHIHLIASSLDLSKTMQSFKSFTARRNWSFPDRPFPSQSLGTSGRNDALRLNYADKGLELEPYSLLLLLIAPFEKLDRPVMESDPHPFTQSVISANSSCL